MKFLRLPLLCLALWLVPPAAAACQGAPAWVAGTVRDPSGNPVAEAKVRVIPLNAPEAGAVRTGADGGFRVALPEGTSDFILSVERIGFVAATLELVVRPGQSLVSRDVVLTPQPLALEGLQVRPPARTSRPVLGTTPGGRDETRLSGVGGEVPLEPGDLASLAALNPGVRSLGGGALSISAQPAEQTSTTLDGASFGASSLPQEGLRSIRTSTTSFDVSRGQFTGGQVAATTLAGTNVFGGAVRVHGGHPWLQVGADGRARESDLLVSGGGGGALVRDRVFVYGAFQAGRRSRASETLASAEPGLLRRAGLSPDAVQRFLSALDGFGVKQLRGDAVSTSASGLLRVDVELSDRHALILRGNAQSADAALGNSLLILPSSPSTLKSSSAGGLLQLTSSGDGWTNALRTYFANSHRSSAGDPDAPGAVVRLGGDAQGDDFGTWVTFGGSSVVVPPTRSRLLELSDDLAWAVGDRHRVRLGFVASDERSTRSGSANPAGVFTFESQDALAAGRAASFSRTLGDQRSVATAQYGALYLGNTWRVRDPLRVTAGVRVEARRYPGSGTATRDPLTGRVPGEVPTEWGVSPRAGVTYSTRLWELRGGAGEFRGRLPVDALAGVRGESGDPAGVLHLMCVGSATPAPPWPGDHGSAWTPPSSCAGGPTPLSARVPRVTVFDAGFRAPRVWRASLGGTWEMLRSRWGRGSILFDVDYLRGADQPVAVERNLGPGVFALAGEGGRAVYVPVEAIDSATGLFAPAAGRVDPMRGATREVRSSGHSSTVQATLGANLHRGNTLWSLHYTRVRARDEVGALFALGAGSLPVASPSPGTLSRGTSDLERRHTFQLQWRHSFLPRAMEVAVIGRFASGAPFTPLVDLDVNGDGAANDPAFVPMGLGGTLAPGLTDALGRTPGCLRGAAGKVAERNICRGPWTGDLDIQANAWRGRRGLTRRLVVSVTAHNVLVGADRMLNGSGGMRGWGQERVPDPVLLHVRGFEPAERRFRYAANPGFGRAGRDVFSNAFALSIGGRWTVGVDPAQQPLITLFSSIQAQGRLPAEILRELDSRIPNVPAQALAADARTGLGLSAEQKSALAAEADHAGTRLAAVARELSEAISTAERASPADRAAAQERVRAATASVESTLSWSVERVRALMTEEQWTRLPAALRRPELQLAAPREITIPMGEP